MVCGCVSKRKSWLLVLMTMLILMVWQTQGVCIEEERKALLEIKASLVDSYGAYFLPTWVDDGSTGGRSGDKCCDWERVTCNTVTGHVTNLSLSNMLVMDKGEYCTRMWPLNVSLFLHFKELTSLNLSINCLDDGIVNTGLGRLSSLKKLQTLDLSENSITNATLPSLGALTSLRVLNLGDNLLEGYFPALALENLEILDLSVNNFLPDLHGNKLSGPFPAKELSHLTNLEELDLSSNTFDGTPSIQDCKQLSSLKKLKSISLRGNTFNKSIILCLSSLPFLRTLDLTGTMNDLESSFPAKELAHMTNLEELDLSDNKFNDTPSIQDCRRLSRLKTLKSVALRYNDFNKSIILCLNTLPSLKTLDLSSGLSGDSFPIQELSGLKELETLDLSWCGLTSPATDGMAHHLPHLKVLLLHANNFNGTMPLDALASFHNLEVLDLSYTLTLVGSIPSTIQALSSLRALSLHGNILNGSLLGLCELKNLHELDLSYNMFDGNLPQCFDRLTSLKLLDISYNQFTGTLPPSLIANLTSLEYVDFSNNRFEGSFSFGLFSNHTKLEVVRFISNNNTKFEVETEEPIGWVPMFQLKVLLLPSCNINRHIGSVVPGFLLHQYKLHALDLSSNSLVGKFPNWLIENNTMLRLLILRNNSLNGTICTSRYMNAKTMWLDVSQNHMNGTIPGDIQKFLPSILFLNLSSNFLNGVIPSSIANMSKLQVLDLSRNELSGEVSLGSLTNLPSLYTLVLSENKLHGQVLSGNLSLGTIERLRLDNNSFTGKFGNWTFQPNNIKELYISNNHFTGLIPHWLGDMMDEGSELLASNNGFEGGFPCGSTSFSFLDISHNSFSGFIPSCINFHYTEHLHLGSNKFTGSIPAFRNMTQVLTLDIGDNSLSGRIPEFLGNLSNLRILILRKNNFSGSIPKQLCQLPNVSLIDISSNSLSGSIPSCLQNIISRITPVFIPRGGETISMSSSYAYQGVVNRVFAWSPGIDWLEILGKQDEVQFTTKALSLVYKGGILDLMVGLDLSCNKLTGEIPKELGSLNQIYSLNLSHNLLNGTIPIQFSNLEKIESLDLSSNRLSGEVPSQLINLTSLAVFNVSHNNLSGKLPEMKAQFGTFSKESYEGNPLLCGPPLEKCVASTSQVNDPSSKEDGDKWHDIDFLAPFYGTWVVFMLGFAAVLYINPYWRRRWLEFVEECMYTCYYFLEDSVRKVSMVFRK